MPAQRNSTQFRRDEELKRIGENIKKARTGKGMTQTELAFKIGDKDASQIGRMERGEVNFQISSLLIVAEVLGTSASELLNPL